MLVAVGCSGRASDADTGAGTQGDDDGGDGGSGDDGASGGDGVGSGSFDDGSDDTTGGPQACDPSDPAIGPGVSVTISNAGDVPLYLPEGVSCAIRPPFSIWRDDAEVTWAVEACLTCTAAAEGACNCPGACVLDTVIRIDPGGSWEGQWTGAQALAAELAAECAGEFCSGACMALLQAPAADYIARAVGGTDVDCGAETCECLGEPSPEGWCSVAGIVSGTETIAEATIAYPVTRAVDVVFR